MFRTPLFKTNIEPLSSDPGSPLQSPASQRVAPPQPSSWGLTSSPHRPTPPASPSCLPGRCVCFPGPLPSSPLSPTGRSTRGLSLGLSLSCSDFPLDSRIDMEFLGPSVLRHCLGPDLKPDASWHLTGTPPLTPALAPPGGEAATIAQEAKLETCYLGFFFSLTCDPRSSASWSRLRSGSSRPRPPGFRCPAQTSEPFRVLSSRSSITPRTRSGLPPRAEHASSLTHSPGSGRGLPSSPQVPPPPRQPGLGQPSSSGNVLKRPLLMSGAPMGKRGKPVTT